MSKSAIENVFEKLETSLQEPNRGQFIKEIPVFIYGAGNVGKDVFCLLRDRGVQVSAFLDRKAKPGACWEDIPILNPKDPIVTVSQRKRSQVVIGIFNYEAEIPPIIKLLKSMGYRRITSFLQFHNQYAAELGDRYWLTSREFYPTHREQIKEGYNLWSDESSRDLYAAILRFRFTMDYEELPNPSLGDQYFPTGLPDWPAPVRFVDCGAFDGDTLRQLVDKKLRLEAVAAFEPDLANFKKLAQTSRACASSLEALITLFPCGVSSTTNQLRFSTGQGTSSCVSESGESIIQCIALDEALFGFHPNVIKMDIEGAEYDALLGAREIIQRDRPGLAICVYHRPEHLWSIPLLAKSWLEGGKHYLRVHTHNGFELIYYWFP